MAHDLNAIAATCLVPLPQEDEGRDFLTTEAAPDKHVSFRSRHLQSRVHFETLFNIDVRIHLTSPFRKMMRDLSPESRSGGAFGREEQARDFLWLIDLHKVIRLREEEEIRRWEQFVEAPGNACI